MGLSRAVLVGLSLLLLSSCIWSQTEAPGGTQTSSPIPAAAAPAVDRLLSQGEIQVAEEHLKNFGFDPGPVDGLFTTQTQAAIRAYQARYGLPVSGLLDYVTRLQLLPGVDHDRPNP
jgi:N-acetylmuramoyl-L-alanine amidase